MWVAFNEQMRRYFRGFAKAAKDAERSASRALRGAAGARKAAAPESLDAVRVGAEATEVEPVAGRLLRNLRRQWDEQAARTVSAVRRRSSST
jgi:hypothetical protein